MEKRVVLMILGLFMALNGLFAQVPQKVNYQGIARDGNGNPLLNTQVGLRLTIHAGAPAGTVVFQETHSPSTNGFGLFNVILGAGTLVSGNFSTIQWGSNSFFFEIELDPNGGTSYTSVGNNQLISVPYALHARTVEVDSVNDADSDPLNEIQFLSKTGNVISLSSGGGSVVLNDDDPTNELQTLSKSGNTITLSNGGSVVLNDDDPTNELQTLSISGNNLSLSNGNTVTLPSSTSGADNDWLWGSAGIHHDSLNVGIGLPANSNYKLLVNNNNVNTSTRYGIRVTQSNFLGSSSYGIYASNSNYYSGSGGNNYGGYFQAYNSSGTSGSTTYGTYSDATNLASGNIASYGSYAIADITGSGTGNTYGNYSSSSNYSTMDGDAFGGYFYAYRNSSTPASDSYGLYANAYSYSTNSGLNYGVYATHSSGSGTRYAGYFNGSVYATGVVTTSDARLKKEIRPYSSALVALSSLNVYRYTFDQESYPTLNLPQGEQVGLMAQELETTFPALVQKAVNPKLELDEEAAKAQFGEGNYTLNEAGKVVVGEEVEFKGVNYLGLVPVMVQSIKELKQLVEDQQKEIESLKSEVKSLQSK
ncbi:MAG: tail fiber domain-containing protein [Bacteroidia bacterium]|nr:tail fiber domain-containing protein [Bacteroidia bacterium]